MTEDEMGGWHHLLNRHESEKTPGDGEGQKSLTCCSPWRHKQSDTTERLNNNNNTETQGLVEVSPSTILDPPGSSPFLPCPRAQPFFQRLCPVRFPPVSAPPEMDMGLGWEESHRPVPSRSTHLAPGMAGQSPADVRLL